LYMTATPRIYGDFAKASAERDDVVLYSMDDEEQFGKVFHTITFSEAVKRGLLVDYKVIVLAVEEEHVNRRIQGLLADENNQLKVDDAARIIGCWKALSKQGLENDLRDDADPMKRAVAFCQVIERKTGGKTHRVSSKHIASMFQAVVEAYQESHEEDETMPELFCEGAYVPLEVDGPARDHLVVFARRHSDQAALVVLPRLVMRLMDGEGRIPASTWSGATIRCPDLARPTLRDALHDRRVQAGETLAAERIVDRFGLALLVTEPSAPASV